MQIQYNGRDLWSCGFDTAKEHATLPPGTCTFVQNGKGVQTALHMSQNPNDVPWEAGALVGLLIVSRIAVYLGLSYKTSSKVR
jgi:hypothetical protein